MKVHVIPKIVTTKRMKGGPNFKGGLISYYDDLHGRNYHADTKH